MIYGNFAQLYDELFDETLYIEWRDFVVQRVTPDNTILDLAGGAGRLAVLLAQKNYSITVADFSAGMLSLADRHARENNVNIPLIEANMLDLSELDQYQTILCFADSLCYLKNLDQITTTFMKVNQHLAEDGKFLFDVITPYQTDHVYPGYMYNYEDDHHERAFMWQSYADEQQAHGVIHELTFFNQLPESKQYERVAETHFEKTYELEQYLMALTQAGFNNINVSADFGRQKINDQTTRWFFECQK
ncbi:class I SAM-dependent DNA methyltransferase [Paucilactobacillus wasatchensis]|uniref:Methyltransferase n=1 Tax=Paucilactobacillus wasatchensis TaxID=1335616 RepID=A0A0D1ABQ5_9LACO|nr:class I SAM-dependent methyltransferase [Paucilactobacillus wasatchensis]KIS04091.1 Methyltransferase [Paucilactobacillus wasatchensis]